MAKVNSSQHFINRKVKLTKCPRCGVSQFEGIAEGLPFRVDPVPLTVAGELVAVTQGRMTYAWSHGLRQCYYRDPMRMRAKPRPMVFAWHTCRQSLHAFIETRWIQTISKVIEDLSRVDTNETVPISEPEENAIFSLHYALGARIIKETIPF